MFDSLRFAFWQTLDSSIIFQTFLAAPGLQLQTSSSPKVATDFGENKWFDISSFTRLSALHLSYKN